jgi:molybdate transport system substrate-binding protein
MTVIVKGALAAGALLVIAAGPRAGLRENGATPNPSPPASAGQKQTLTVAAASDLKFALDELLKEFRARHPGTEVQVTYGSSGNFLAQFGNGAPFDVFLSASSTPWAASWCGCRRTRRCPWSSVAWRP